MPGAAYQSRPWVEGTRLPEVGYQSRLATVAETTSTERYAIGDVIDDRYEVLAIHRGTMGVVYGTFDRELKLPRALKTLQHRFAANATMRDLFTAEATTWVRLEKHPFIVRAHLVGRFEDQPYVITEYIRGQEGMAGDLRGWLGHPRLTLPVAAELALQIAQAMQHATRKVPGLVHRDLKPANILVDERGRALVTDFGLAHAAEADAGTPAYMAPEQWRREELDQRSDIYAFGCIVHEMLTGRRLYGAVTVDDWQTVHLSHAPVSPRDLRGEVPAALDDLVRRCLAKEASARPPTWDDVVSRCASAFHEVTGQPAVFDFSAYELTADELATAGHSLSVLRDYREALDACERAIEAAPMNAVAWGLKGNALRNLQRYVEAIACYDRAVTIDSRFIAAWQSKAFTLNILKRHREAIDCCDRAIEIDLESQIAAAAWETKGDALIGLEIYDRVVACYDRAVDVGSRYTIAWLDKARWLSRLKRYNEAIACYDRALNIDPQDGAAWINKGNVLADLERYDEANACYQNALEIDPRNSSVWAAKGQSLCDLERYDEAIACYDRALDIDPRSAMSWINKGNALCKLNRCDEATACYDRALGIDPRSTLAWIHKGKALMDLKHYDLAIACYDRVLEMFPSSAWGIELRTAAETAMKGQRGGS